MKLEDVDRTNAISDKELLDDLVRVSRVSGHGKVTISEYDAVGKYDSSTIMRHFQTWNAALILAGLQISNRQYTVEELYDNLAEIWLKVGRQPSKRDLEKFHSPISYKAYERRFGKWSTAVKSFVDYYNSTNTSAEVRPDEQRKIVHSKHETRRDVNLRLRFLVMQRDHFCCCLCGASPAKDPAVVLHVDHIIPWAKGGETVLDNLQTLCSKCNLGKGDVLPKNNN